MLAAWGEETLLGKSTQTQRHTRRSLSIKLLALFDLIIICVGIPILQRRSRWNTPWIALLTNAILITIGTAFPFEFLIQMDQLFYSIGLILEHLALLWLRFKVRLFNNIFSNN
jgi:amino acid transporter